MANVMQVRKQLAATFSTDKALCVATGDMAQLRRLMELTDDILSGRHDVPADIEAMSDEELLAALNA